MQISKIEVFECPKCGSLSKEQDSVIKCLKKHRTQELKAEKEAKFHKLFGKVSNYMIDNLTSLHSDEIQNHLVSAANILGLNLTFSAFRVSTPTRGSFDGGLVLLPIQVVGDIKRNPSSAFDGISIPSGVSFYLTDLLKNKEPYFGDFIRSINGMDTGSGGGGGTFHYEIRLILNKFPALFEKLKEFDALSAKRTTFNNRSSELRSDYNKNRLPAILISDIRYQEILSEREDLSHQIGQLQEKFKIVDENLRMRKNDMVNADMGPFIKPEDRFNYDVDRLNQLKSELYDG
jgi:hypothetical protein